MTATRTESDLLGSLPVPATALYGIYTQRALANFDIARRPVATRLIHAFGQVKQACALTNHELGRWEKPAFDAIVQACAEMTEGLLDEHILVDAWQGGAGTSTNMNVNEVLTNRALQILGQPLGAYHTLHPLDDMNCHQSTNDTYPTALKVAALFGLQDLEREVVLLQEAFQSKEQAFAHVVKVGRTQLQDAVLMTLGAEMGAYAEAFNRDRWRIYQCTERLRVVNLGGTAIGTGLGAPRQYIFRVVEHLRALTGLGLARAENMIDNTQNLDALVEVSGILRVLAATLLKISNDLRLLASGPAAGIGEIILPPRQAGSSLMPGKVNPVIPESVGQAALMVMAHDQALVQACALGNLELNQYLPLVADCLLSNIEVLTRACHNFRRLCVEGITANEAHCKAYVGTTTATATALVSVLGYQRVEALVHQATASGRSLREEALAQGLLTAAAFDEATSPAATVRLGSPPAPTPTAGWLP
jgi:aspartate ammonia-lyase